MTAIHELWTKKRELEAAGPQNQLMRVWNLSLPLLCVSVCSGTTSWDETTPDAVTCTFACVLEDSVTVSNTNKLKKMLMVVLWSDVFAVLQDFMVAFNSRLTFSKNTLLQIFHNVLWLLLSKILWFQTCLETHCYGYSTRFHLSLCCGLLRRIFR
jgi:hypothetical protein